ncbi:MAG TPA: hypothetical protein VGI39_19740, partial [Polyangiaceae bacterium]
IHGVTMPLIILSGLMLLAPFGPSVPGVLDGRVTLNLGLLIFAATAVSFLFLERLSALVMIAWLAGLVVLAAVLSHRMSVAALLGLNAAVQLVSWYLAVHVGHERFEPSLLAADARGQAPVAVSSNLYFRRGYFVLRNVGRPVTELEAFQQFAVSPYAATLDLLFSLGYRPALRARIEELSSEYAGRIARGEVVLGAEDGSMTNAPLSPFDVDVAA